MLTVRKGGKLPGPVIGVDYALEYGTARMELRPDSVHEGDRVLVIDDVMATGGTAKASIQLLEQAGASVEAICVLLELEGLGGRNVIDQSIFEPIVVIEIIDRLQSKSAGKLKACRHFIYAHSLVHLCLHY